MGHELALTKNVELCFELILPPDRLTGEGKTSGSLISMCTESDISMIELLVFIEFCASTVHVHESPKTRRKIIGIFMFFSCHIYSCKKPTFFRHTIR